MKIKFYGTRGSTPTPSKRDFSTVKYGGNTTCVTVEPEESRQVYILDAGSGIREAGNALLGRGESLEMKLLVTHDHWDHVQGFPFFVPAYIPGNKLDVYSCDSRLQNKLKEQNKQADSKPTERIKRTGTRAISHRDPENNHPKRVMQDVMDTDKKYFPVPLEAMNAEVNFHEVRKHEIIEGPLDVSYQFLNTHPQGYTYWRLQEGDRTMVFASDYESDGFQLTGEKGTLGELDQKFVKFAQGADVLILDGQYTPEQYPKCKGWGHNDIEQACHLAKAANVKTLVITHHDPMSNDAKLDEMQQHTVNYMNSLDENIQVIFAQEDMSLEIGENVSITVPEE